MYLSHISIWQERCYDLYLNHTYTHKISICDELLISQAVATEGMGLPASSSWLSNIYFNTLQWLSKLLLSFIIFSEVLSISSNFCRSCFSSFTLCIFSSFALPDLFSGLFSPVVCPSRLNIVTVLSDVYFLNLA